VEQRTGRALSRERESSAPDELEFTNLGHWTSRFSRVLGRLLERIVGHEEFRFAQGSKVAGWRLNPVAK